MDREADLYLASSRGHAEPKSKIVLGGPYETDYRVFSPRGNLHFDRLQHRGCPYGEHCELERKSHNLKREYESCFELRRPFQRGFSSTRKTGVRSLESKRRKVFRGRLGSELRHDG